MHRIEIGAQTHFGPLDRPGVRVDAGIESGSEISTFYDPMLAKVISWAPTRGRAAAILARTLSDAALHGPTTNRDMLVNTLRESTFLSGDTDTGYLEQIGLDVLSAPLADESTVTLTAVAATLAEVAVNRERARVQRSLPAGWRNMPSQYSHKIFRTDDVEHEVRYRCTRCLLYTSDAADE